MIAVHVNCNGNRVTNILREPRFRKNNNNAHTKHSPVPEKPCVLVRLCQTLDKSQQNNATLL